MKTFWDLTEKERANLDRDGVAAYCDAELMLKGVLRPEPLPDAPEPQPGPLPTSTYYRVGTGAYNMIGLAFASEADARAFIALRPRVIGNVWSLGNVECVEPTFAPAAFVRTVELPTEEDVKAATAALKEVKAAKEAFDSRATAHAEQTRKVEEALSGLWEEWHACRAKAAQVRRVLETFEKYTSLAGGDLAVASKFLQQAFAITALAEAEEWSGVKMVIEPAPQAIAYAEAG